MKTRLITFSIALLIPFSVTSLTAETLDSREKAAQERDARHLKLEKERASADKQYKQESAE